MRRILPLLFLLSMAAMAYPPGPQVLTFFSEVDDSDQPYALYLPKDFDPQKNYPLVLSLHGAMSNHRLNLKRVFGLGNRNGESDPEATRYWPNFPNVQYIVAAPYARGTMGYGLFAESDVWAVLADVRQRFRIDEDRIYLTGLSMGGGGTLSLALSRPDVFAAIAPVCPAVFGNERNKVMNILNVPSWFHHGDKDTAVNVSVSRDFVFRLKYIGASVEYSEYPGVGHNSWENAYRDGQIFAWFDKHKRNRFPAHVRYFTDSYRYDRAYWLRFTRLTPGAATGIDAVFVAPNEINFLSENLGGVAFELKGHPMYDATKPLLIRADGGEFSIPAGQLLAARKSDKGEWEAGAGTPAAGEKEPGFEGPVGAAFAGRHIYVYGTKDKPDAAELRRRRQEAERAANWDSGSLKLLYSPRVIADKDVRETDIKESSLILFGTAETNTHVEAYGARAPLALKAGVKDFGLILVIPGEAAGRYVVINSGLPFTSTGGMPVPGFMAMQPQVLGRAPDFALFKGGVQNIVAAGRYDNQWQISASDKQKLRDSGVVELR